MVQVQVTGNDALIDTLLITHEGGIIICEIVPLCTSPNDEDC
jgi:hypothetical protein